MMRQVIDLQIVETRGAGEPTTWPEQFGEVEDQTAKAPPALGSDIEAGRENQRCIGLAAEDLFQFTSEKVAVKPEKQQLEALRSLNFDGLEGRLNQSAARAHPDKFASNAVFQRAGNGEDDGIGIARQLGTHVHRAGRSYT